MKNLIISILLATTLTAYFIGYANGNDNATAIQDNEIYRLANNASVMVSNDNDVVLTVHNDYLNTSHTVIMNSIDSIDD